MLQCEKCEDSFHFTGEVDPNQLLCWKANGDASSYLHEASIQKCGARTPLCQLLHKGNKRQPQHANKLPGKKLELCQSHEDRLLLPAGWDARLTSSPAALEPKEGHEDRLEREQMKWLCRCLQGASPG